MDFRVRRGQHFLCPRSSPSDARSIVLRPMMVGLLIGLVVGAAGAWLLLRSKHAELASRFDALAADALRKNNESFLDLAATRLGQKEHAVEQLVQPLKESLARVNEQAEALERSRRQDYGRLSEAVRNLAQTGERVRSET